MSALAAISMLGVLVFWGIGLFVAAHWWQPILAWVISMTLPSIIGAILDSIMPRVARAIGAISPIISLILSIIAYIVWY